jgi:DNA-binding NarL/FixJ family response regulator
MIRLLLVDDQTLIRRGLKALLKPETELEIIGEAADGQAALLQIEALQPDLVLMDIRMPIMDGVAATREISQRFPQVKVLILTTFDDTEYVSQALQCGAAGYLLKDTPVEELVQAIQLVHKGYTQLAPGLAQKLMAGATAATTTATTTTTIGASSTASSAALDAYELTPREQEILKLIAAGASNKEIAQQLYISEKTVKNHITSILSRLGLRDRTQAAILVHSIVKN